MSRFKTKGFSLVELLVVTIIVGILSSISLPQISKYNNQAGDAWRQAVVKNVAKIIMADEFVSLDGVNFADLDADNDFIGTNDPVTLEDIKQRLIVQNYTLESDNQDACFLYGYTSTAADNDEMLVIVGKDVDTGTGALGFIFDGTDKSVLEAENVTAIDCTPGSEGVTGGTWTNYYWTNLMP